MDQKIKIKDSSINVGSYWEAELFSGEKVGV